MRRWLWRLLRTGGTKWRTGKERGVCRLQQLRQDILLRRVLLGRRGLIREWRGMLVPLVLLVRECCARWCCWGDPKRGQVVWPHAAGRQYFCPRRGFKLGKTFRFCQITAESGGGHQIVGVWRGGRYGIVLFCRAGGKFGDTIARAIRSRTGWVMTE